MNLCDLNYVRGIMSEFGARPAKSLGQNFLIESWVPERIASSCPGGPDCGVLEVGPGVGALTRQLAGVFGKVVSLELDRKLLPILDQTTGDLDNVTVTQGDVLKADLAGLCSQYLPDMELHACANLPYYITTPAIIRLVEARMFHSVTVMVQREVALRICAAAGTSDYGAFSLFCQYHSEPELLFEVPPDCFYPRPAVTSAVVRMTTRSERLPFVRDEDMFFRVVRASFNHRRKTLANCLKSAFPNCPADIASRLEGLGLSPTVRGERLDLRLFAAVADIMLDS